MIRENEDRILNLTEANQKLQTQISSKDDLISKYEAKLKNVEQHSSDNKMIHVELSDKSLPPFEQNNVEKSRMEKLCDISLRLSKMNEQFERKMDYLNNEEFHIKTSLIK